MQRLTSPQEGEDGEARRGEDEPLAEPGEGGDDEKRGGHFPNPILPRASMMTVLHTASRSRSTSWFQNRNVR